MSHIISNTGNPSLSRNHAFQEGVWQTFDGLSYTCKIGNFIYDWNLGASASGKQFLAIQSPATTFHYKPYIAGECKYFDVQFGTGDTKDKDKEKSKLIPPPSDYLDPMQFNANWQAKDESERHCPDDSMISWISTENNTGTTNSTFVMVNGEIYDLGKPILGAALNEGFILAIHCETGRAFLCEYEIDNGTIKKRIDQEIVLPTDSGEISRVQGLISNINSEISAIDRDSNSAYAGLDEIRSSDGNPSETGKGFAFDYACDLLHGITPDSTFWGYREQEIKGVTAAGTAIYNYEKTFITDKRQHSGAYRFFLERKKVVLQDHLANVQSGKGFSIAYRASFSSDISLITDEEQHNAVLLLHLNGDSVRGIHPREASHYTTLAFNTPLQPVLPNGFVTFDLNIKWENKQEIENAIENKLPVPKKVFKYTTTKKQIKRFDKPMMTLSAGSNKDATINRRFGIGNASVGKLKSDNVFLFAELVGREPRWLTANIDIDMYIGVSFPEDGYVSRGQLNWMEVV